MKIFLTEYELEDKTYAGINIFASTSIEAELIAEEQGVTIIGEITGVKFKEEFDNYLTSEVQQVLH
jgi:hypothetical protein